MMIIMAGVGRLAKLIQLAVVTEVAGLAGCKVGRIVNYSVPNERSHCCML